VAGVKPDPRHKFDGVSLLPLLQQTGGLDRDALFWHYPHYNDRTTPHGSIRKGDFKLIEYFEDGRLELYNLRGDVGEKDNLASSKRGKARELQQVLAKWRKHVGAQMPPYRSRRANNPRQRRLASVIRASKSLAKEPPMTVHRLASLLGILALVPPAAAQEARLVEEIRQEASRPNRGEAGRPLPLAVQGEAFSGVVRSDLPRPSGSENTTNETRPNAGRRNSRLTEDERDAPQRRSFRYFRFSRLRRFYLLRIGLFIIYPGKPNCPNPQRSHKMNIVRQTAILFSRPHRDSRRNS
jgi:hypothetical protein